MTLPAMIYEGSVKNVRGEKGKAPYIFEFSDRYSIFDWGQMPDLLTDKGASLAFMGWFFFMFGPGFGILASDHGPVFQRLKSRWVRGGAIVGAAYGLYKVLVSDCYELKHPPQREPRRPRAGPRGARPA